MMTAFTIDPYIGPIPLRFGMTPIEVESLIGKPLEVGPGSQDDFVEYRSTFRLGYAEDSQELYEANFSPGSVILFSGVNLFRVPDPITYLRRFDDSPFEVVGLIVFLKLGIQLSGYHDSDDDKTISVIEKGIYDDYYEYFKKF